MEVPKLPARKHREKGKQYMKNGKIRIWNGRELLSSW